MNPQQIERVISSVLEQQGSEISESDKREIVRQAVDSARRREIYVQKMQSPEFRWKKPNSLR